MPNNRFVRQKTLLLAGAFFLLICAIVSILCFQYYRHLQKTIKSETNGYLQEISRQMSDNINRIIRDNFSVLTTVSSVVEHSGLQTLEELSPVLRDQQKIWQYQNFLLIDESGNARDMSGKVFTFIKEPYLLDVLMDGKKRIATSSILGNTENVLFLIPVSGFTLDGANIKAMAVGYDFTTLGQALLMTAFDGLGYAHVIQKNGSMVIRSASSFAPPSGYNILNTFKQVLFDDDYTQEIIQADINSGKSSLVSYRYLDEHKYMMYTPLESNEWYLLTFVPSKIINQKTNLLLKITLLMCGFITVLFTGLLGMLVFTFYRNRKRLEKIAYVDPVTGGNTIQCFYEHAEILLSSSKSADYMLVYVNIEKFKIFNEQLGRNACDIFLKKLYTAISSDLSEKECAGHLFADNICILMSCSSEKELPERFGRWFSLAVEEVGNKSVWSSAIMSFGVYVIANNDLSFPLMIDRAKIALKNSMQHISGKIRYAIYDDEIRRRMFREKHLEDMMETALKNSEFQVYLQPKYTASDEKIGGAEALVRWQSPTEGMIFPDEFISLFEKNGFIVQLDLWVFEETCRIMHTWIAAGELPVKVSVNCSRVHLKTPQFLDQYCNICDKWDIPRRFIEIELTESVVFEDVKQLTKVIRDIHDAGFDCAMDDFGSGYSSLNMIKDIPVDTLKLDKIFFRNTESDLERTESVIKSILMMAKSLNLETVAEGVEKRVQVDMLKRLDCDLIQGFFFAKPQPAADFEKLAFGRVIQNQ